MSILDDLIPKAQAAGATIVLPEGNDPRVMKAAIISTDDSTLKAIVMPTNEELMIARDTMVIAGEK